MGDKISVGNLKDAVGVAIGDNAQVSVQQLLQPIPAPFSALVRPLIEHYTAVFGGRDAELAALDVFLHDPQHPFGLLVAPTGLGKTALLVHWIARVQQQHPAWRVIFAPVSIRYQTASEPVVLGILAQSLAALHNDMEQFRSYDQSPSSLRALIADYLRRPLPPDRPLLVVLDGIDEATGWTVGPTLAAAPAQPGLKLLVAARQRANRTRDDWCQQLGWEAAQVGQLELHALERPAIAALLSQSGLTCASEPAFVAAFSRVSEGDPLTSNLLIKGLRSGAITPDSLPQRPPGLAAFLTDWVETLRTRRTASRPIRELLALCAAAYGPLTSDDLQALAPEVFVEQSEIVDAVCDDQVARFIITVGEAQHTYVFSHQRLREVFLEQLYPPKDRERLHQRLIAYGEAWYAERTTPLPDYLRQCWVTHLKAANAWAQIRRVLTEIVPSADGMRQLQPWQTARYAAEGSDSGYLSELDLLWSHAEEQHDLGLALRCALIAASLRSRSGNLSPELLVQLVQIGTPEGRWSGAAALEHIAQMPDSKNQAKCIMALLHAGITLPWQRALEIARALADDRPRAEALTALTAHRPDLLPVALEAARAIAADQSRAQALTALAPHLPPELLPEALEAARAIADENDRVQALTALAAHLPPNLLSEALAAARAIASDLQCAEVLTALAPKLPPHLLPEALAIARAMSSDWHRAGTLTALAPHLPPELLPEALEAARAISDERPRADTLRALVAQLPHLLPEALAAARAIPDAPSRAQALTALVAQLPHLLPEALEAARAISAALSRARALTALLAHLPELLPEVLAAARAISADRPRAEALTALAAQLPMPNLLPEALQAARAIADDLHRAEALTALAAQLPMPNLLPEALQAARAIADDLHRAEALTALVAYLPELLPEALAAARAIAAEQSRARVLMALAAHQPELLPEALAAAARTISDDQSHAKAFTALVAQMPELLPEVLAAARAMSAATSRARALTALVPHLPDLLPEALAAARAIAADWNRAEAITALAPQLPPDLLPEALAAARAMSADLHRARTLTALVPHLPDLLPEALQAARAITGGFLNADRTRALTALAPQLPPHLLPEVLAAARAIAADWPRAEALTALVPHLPELLPEALAAARAIPDDSDRARALTALVAQLPHLLPEALATARAIAYDWPRARALTALAPKLADVPTNDHLFLPTLRVCAQRGRPALLSELAALEPWLAALAERAQQAAALVALAHAIIETAQCWP